MSTTIPHGVLLYNPDRRHMKTKRHPILLVNPPNDLTLIVSNKKKAGVIYPPGGLLSLAACLEKENFPVKLLDLIAEEMDARSLLSNIKKSHPFFIGITSCSPQIKGATSLAKFIKKHFPKIIVGVGGPHPSAYYQNLQKIPYFDFIFVGEGEITLPKILKEMDDNISQRGKYVNKKYIKKVYFGEEVKDLDSLPFMARHLLKKELYSLGIYKKFVTIHSGRGCPFKCVFCSSPIERRRFYRGRSVESVIREIEYCVKVLKTEFILFTDDTFTASRQRIVDICNEIIKRKLKFNFCCETRVELVDEELIILLKKAGLSEIQFGVESGSERVRQEVIHKNFSKKHLKNALYLSKKHGLYSIAFIMMGFPTETKRDLMATSNLCLKLPINIIGIHFTVIMPGSDLYGIAVGERKISDDYWNKYAMGEVKEQPIYVPDGITLDVMEKIRRLTYKKFYLNVKFLLNRIIYDLKNPLSIIEDSRLAISIFSSGRTDRGRV